MIKAAGGPSATCALLVGCGLAISGCTSRQATSEVDVRYPLEQSIYVELPGNTTLNADELRQSYYKGRRTLSHVRARCVTAPGAGGSCAQTTDVRISAVEGAKFVDAGDAPNKPQLIAWLENLGTAATFDGIQPLSDARYALVVNTRPHANPEIMLVDFPGVRTSRKTASVKSYGNVYQCHNYGVRLISDADYQVCSPRYGGVLTAPDRLHNTSLLTGMLSWTSVLSFDDPTWFSCASGCCSSSAVNALN